MRNSFYETFLERLEIVLQKFLLLYEKRSDTLGRIVVIDDLERDVLALVNVSLNVR